MGATFQAPKRQTAFGTTPGYQRLSTRPRDIGEVVDTASCREGVDSEERKGMAAWNEVKA